MRMPEPDSSGPGPSHTIASAQRTFAGELRHAGIEGAGDDVRRLMASALQLSSADLLREPERALGVAQAQVLRGYIERRKRHEPVSRILGCRDFYGRTFAISPATLDPRPDSETLIAATLELVHEEGWLHQPLRILDVGTGSGCLLLTLLCELSEATGLGTDISASALATAQENARRLGVEERAAWSQNDALEGIAGPFHILVANPPYVRTADIAHLDLEVRDFDPVQALDGGADGLKMYRRLVPGWRNLILGGWVVLEVGHDQADAVAALLGSEPGIDAHAVRIHRDVSGKRRCVAARTLS
jgi:release factor glutamine methyltransferase